MKKYYLILAFIAYTVTSIGQAGELDLSFNGDGKVTLDLSYDDVGTTVAIQADEKLVVGGVTNNTNADLVVTRLDRYGNPDLSFGNLGITELDFSKPNSTSNELMRDVSIKADGRIILLAEAQVQSESGLMLVRLQANGQLDYTFADSGKVFIDNWYGKNYWTSVVNLPNGKIIVAGRAYGSSTIEGVLVGFNEDGSRDYTFGDSSLVSFSLSGGSVQLNQMLLAGNGDLLLVGSGFAQGEKNFLAARISSKGVFDATFGGNGISIFPFGGSAVANDVHLNADGSMVLAGDVYLNGRYQVALAKVLSDGTLDQNFGTNGKVITPILDDDTFIEAVGVLGDGKILISGTTDGIWNEDIVLARYRTDGSLDNSFSYDGIATKNLVNGYDRAFDALVQPNGRMVIVGYSFENGSNSSVITVSRFLGGQGTVGEEEWDDLNKLVIFPNPASSQISIDLANSEEVYKLELINSVGGIVKKVPKYQSGTAILLDDFISGVYILKVDDFNGQVTTRRLVIR